MTRFAEHPLMITDPELDLAARSFWEQDFEQRDKAFARLRTEQPVSYSRPYESTLLPPDENTPGFWSVTKAADCRHVSRSKELFCSGLGVLMEDMPIDAIRATASFLVMDGEDHRRLRGLIQQAFTARNIRKLADWVAQTARERLDEIIDRGEGDFADLYAKYVPGRIFAHFFGVERDSEEQHVIMEAAERMLAWDDPRMALGRDALTTHVEEAMRIQAIALAQAQKCRKDPKDDLMSWVANAEFEGKKLDDQEIMSFFSLLGSAANDTTRHTIAHAVRLFAQHPDQRDLLVEDLPGRLGTAVEEVVRYSSPVMHFRRTATADTTIGDVEIKKGEHVVMWYCSANRDAEAFENPGTFDILRNPNDHLGFGGGGPHFCLGNTLARQMLSAVFTEIYTRIPDITLAGEPQFQINNFIHGVHSLPARWTPPTRR
ncbi:cytochrome hydroxylase [Mycobacterium persicum]|uniref:Cytochrome hydroxylase n=2 Tax=Mycobacteriaceae TaxID=1762 RepID=A0A8E2LQ77_9MYCO|nr:cytochrome P450 [Mycobacterium persicum]ORC13216.1 cytochrome hydroxylase [Mycobacterium kansasii]ORB56616.1 cytochrome hydroxylase [Mycobacterium persicum]ORB96850.1 cytochrome hydroxylase [Mycobacterium persicum]ORC09018.1 cytochrome hydroxylase [Mycobacterium persicum]VAZ73285.1 Methyl-branched lipid omega-hydroxylase [Mycobacterium persicum]